MALALLVLAALNGIKGTLRAVNGGASPTFYFIVAAGCACCAIACLVQARRMDP